MSAVAILIMLLGGPVFVNAGPTNAPDQHIYQTTGGQTDSALEARLT